MPSLLRACVPTPLIGRTAGGRAFRTHGRTFCWAFGTHGGTFGACQRRAARGCPFQGVLAGHQVCQVRLCRVDQVCPRPVPLAGLAPDGLAERLVVGPLQDGLVEGLDDPAACHRQNDPDARRPCAWAEWGTPIGRRRLPYWRIDPDLIPAAIIPAPTVVPG
jgi:hypothetical protein